MTVINETPAPDLNQIVAELSKLSPLEYDQVREEKAKELNVRVSTLDKEVVSAREIDTPETSSVVEDLELWPETVKGDELLEEISSLYEQHVYLPHGAINALAAWTLGTYCMDAWSIWPKLLITSPEKRCGKTTLLEVIESLCCRALAVSNISPSAIFRCIDEWKPTLILDEADTFTRDNDELNGIVNAGHRKRTARVIRSEKVNEGFIPKAYSVWAPQVIAGIGSQRDTLHDRSIHIEMERKLPDERVEKVPLNLFERCETLRRKCLRWANDRVNKLDVGINIPHYGNDRAQDNWEPLIRIGLVAGKGWEEKLLTSYKLFSVIEAEEDAGIILLRDIQTILKSHPYDNISSSNLVERLIEIEDSPWFEWKKGKPITQNSLARLLKPFKISSGTVRLSSGSTAKGYKLKQFENACNRYIPSPIPPIQSVTPSQTAPSKGLREFQSVTSQLDVTFQNRCGASKHKGCDVVTVQNDTIESQGDKQPDFQTDDEYLQEYFRNQKNAEPDNSEEVIL